jgi:hypothetical protein
VTHPGAGGNPLELSRRSSDLTSMHPPAVSTTPVELARQTRASAVKVVCSFRRLTVNNCRCAYRHTDLGVPDTTPGRPRSRSRGAPPALPFARIRSASRETSYVACWCGICGVRARPTLYPIFALSLLVVRCVQSSREPRSSAHDC